MNQPRAQEKLSDAEKYLHAILADDSGIDLAEFVFTDEMNDDRCYRVYPYQWSWFREPASQVIAACSRSVGKSESIMLEVASFPYNYPNQEQVLVVPEGTQGLNLTTRIQAKFESTRFMRETIPNIQSSGITQRPFTIKWGNGARFFVRLPQRDGRGVRGCVGAGSMVLVKDKGLVEVENVKVGDFVWSHLNRWSKVIDTHSFESETIRIHGGGSNHIVTTPNHRMYGRVNEARQPKKQKRKLGNMTWMSAEDMLSEVEETGGVNFYWSGPGKGSFDSHISTDIPVLENHDVWDEDFWWVIGRWLADGYTTSQKLKGGGSGRKRTHWCLTRDQLPALADRLDRMGWAWNYKDRSHSSAGLAEHSSGELVDWLEKNFGKLAHGKCIPGFAFTLPDNCRRNMLDGYLSGDGTEDSGRDRNSWSSASKKLAVGMGIIAQSLGYPVGFGLHLPKPGHSIDGVNTIDNPLPSWRGRRTNPDRGRGIDEDGYMSYRVRKVEQSEPQTVYNIISEDHSYMVDGIFHHNTHPVKLHIDESQDVTDATYAELPEVVRKEVPGWKWKMYGVSKGIRGDYFWNACQPGSGWVKQQYTGMHRPSWTDQEREDKIKDYGGYASPAYVRNVWGEPGDEANSIFVLANFMRCVDTREGSDYNTQEYFHTTITGDMVRSFTGVQDLASGGTGDLDPRMTAIESMLQFPASHTSKYQTFWVGMDVGLVSDPTEIMIVSEYELTGPEKSADKRAELATPDAGLTRFKLVGRVSLKEIPAPLQAKVIMYIIGHYRPKGFAMDSTGNGLPTFQALQELAGSSRFAAVVDPNEDLLGTAKKALTLIKGYGFSSKIPVAIDEQIANKMQGKPPSEILKEAGIYWNVADRATEVLRQWVDTQRFLLPYDMELIQDMNAQTFTLKKNKVDPWGRSSRSFSKGEFHILDGMRMMALAASQKPIEDFIASEKPKQHTPIIPRVGFS